MTLVHPRLCIALAAGLSLTFASSGCVEPVENTLPAVIVEVTAPRIEISGPTAIEIDQSATLTAQTVGADDTAYTWASLDDTVATVDAGGVVTAVAVGVTTITAAGVTSERVGQHVVVGTAVPTPGGPTVPIPYYELWVASPHNDAEDEPFTHWDSDDPPVIPAGCARCHSTPGFEDFLGADGSAAGVVDAPAPVGTTIACEACHNAATELLDHVTFPSGAVVTGLGPEATCMTCHQGRASTDTVNAAIAAAGPATDDTVSDELSFLNIHYYAAGATLFAGQVRGGYQYEDKVYDWRFRHVPGFDTCVGCHDKHSLEVKVDQCAECHTSVATLGDLKDIRMMASLNQDYDGDGDTTEGIYYEFAGLRDRLLAAIRAYTTAEGIGNVCYSGSAYPYWFIDTDNNGACSATEAVYANRYKSWNPRLVRAAYNYQVSLKDPGAFAHNAKYIIQLLFDAISDIATATSAPELLGDSVRNDFGHFNGASEAARHWDTTASETVDASCASCHGGSDGFHFYLEYGVGSGNIAPDNGLDCTTCHTSFGTSFDVVEVASVKYASGVTIADADPTTNMCSTCHQGRESKLTIDTAIAANKLSFRNIHYLPAGATRQGSDAQMGYEYDGNTYAAAWTGHPGGDNCVSCHSASNTNHSFRVEDNFAACTTCHQAASELHDIRAARHNLDYDGNGNASEPLANEVNGLAAKVLAAMGSATSNGICYNSAAYPYFFKDTDQNGACDASESIYPNRYAAWTPALMKAAHNYQFSQKDPGSWAHNFDYMGQLLFDSIADLGGSTAALSRP